jgi:hypothetical protein
MLPTVENEAEYRVRLAMLEVNQTAGAWQARCMVDV